MENLANTRADSSREVLCSTENTVHSAHTARTSAVVACFLSGSVFGRVHRPAVLVDRVPKHMRPQEAPSLFGSFWRFNHLTARSALFSPFAPPPPWPLCPKMDVLVGMEVDTEPVWRTTREVRPNGGQDARGIISPCTTAAGAYDHHAGEVVGMSVNNSFNGRSTIFCGTRRPN